MKMKKRTMGLIIIPVLVVLAVIIFLTTYTFKVQGSVSNIATKQPLKDVQVKIGGHTATTDNNGHYSISGIKIYEKGKLLQVDPPDKYVDPEATKVAFKGKSAIYDINVEPTIEEINNLLNTASLNHQYDYLWDFMHPDDQKYWGKKSDYVSLLKERDDLLSSFGQTTKSFSIGENIRTLKTWKSDVTNKDYTDVLEVPNRVILVIDGKEKPDTDLNYYQKVDGFYHYFTQVNKEELKQAIDDLNSLQ